MTICILTPAPGYYEDWSVPKGHYEKLLGPDLAFRPWTEPGDLSAFDLILPLLAWGYQRDCAAWFALLERLASERLPVANPVEILRWNTDKSYLLDLEKNGVPIVPTRLSQSLNQGDVQDARRIFGCARLVVKPPISGGADGTYLIDTDQGLPEATQGKQMLIQPYLPAIADEGEYSLFLFAGQYSHAIVKRPNTGDFRVQEQFGGREQTIEPTQEARALADTAVAIACEITKVESLTYARVDMIRGLGGGLALMELELIEPSLFLHHSGDDGAALVRAIRAAA